jgi:fatty-acyl-CoA synthase
MPGLDFIVRRGAHTRPGRTALVDGDLRWTWSEFDAQVTRAADALRAAGIGAGDRVAGAAYNSAAYFALYYGAARLGAIVCPLNYLCARAELEYVLRNLDPALVLVAPEFEPAVAAAAAAAVPAARLIGFDAPGCEWDRLTAAADPGARFAPVDPGSVHQVLYTSGTTGRPKGVCHTHLAQYVDGLGTALGYGLSRDDRYVLHAPSFHGASWDHAKLFFVCDGMVVITPRFDPVAVLEAIAGHGVTVLFGVPAVLRLLMLHPRWNEFDLSSLRLVYFGGALGSLSALAEFSAALGRRVDYMQIYGLTEAGPFVTVAPPETLARKPRSVGKSLPGIDMDLIVPATGRSAAPGEVGEIVVSSPSMMSGYWRDPEATAAAIRDGWLHTGDLATRDEDGDFTIVDRLKDMVRSGGENVYAAEVERVLATHPQVAEAAVLGLPDERWDERVVAVVSVRAGAGLEAEALRLFCREHLAAYKVPKQVEFVTDFPRTGLGKIAKHVLRDRLLGDESANGGG